MVYLGNTPCPKAVEAIEEIRKLGLKVFFVTNNSSKHRLDILKKLNQLGIPSSLEEIITSAYAAGMFLALSPRPSSKQVLVLGSEGLREEIEECHIECVNTSPCDTLVVGFDTRFNYDSICRGLDAIKNGARFIVCNVDPNYPVEDGRLLPGCGAMVAAIEEASGRSPEVVIGKPNPFMLQLVSDKTFVPPEEILMIGDTIETDMLMAKRFGSKCIFIGNIRPYDYFLHTLLHDELLISAAKTLWDSLPHIRNAM